MRVRHYLGFPILAIGASGVLLGHHWLGPVWFWLGVTATALGITLIASGGFEDRVRKGLRNHRGPGDYGNVDYHQGAYEGSHSSDGGGDGGGGD